MIITIANRTYVFEKKERKKEKKNETEKEKEAVNSFVCFTGERFELKTISIFVVDK